MRKIRGLALVATPREQKGCHVADILFVCTGNIFRSMTAEYALLRELERLGAGGAKIAVASAGTRDDPSLEPAPMVVKMLSARGLDVTAHRRRLLTSDMLARAGTAIAMHTTHRALLAEQFGHQAPLYSEACGLAGEPLPDVDDLFAPEEFRSPAAIAHIEWTLDRIIELAPRLARAITSPA